MILLQKIENKNKFEQSFPSACRHLLVKSLSMSVDSRKFGSRLTDRHRTGDHLRDVRGRVLGGRGRGGAGGAADPRAYKQNRLGCVPSAQLIVPTTKITTHSWRQRGPTRAPTSARCGLMIEEMKK